MDIDHQDGEGEASNADRAASDADQTISTSDQASADSDQRASDRDQLAADRDHAADRDANLAAEKAYRASRRERETTASTRRGTRLRRASTARARDTTASHRDRLADARDEASTVQSERALQLARATLDFDSPLLEQVEQLAAQATAHRARGAAERTRAARERAMAVRERARLEAEVVSAHLDDLTGVYRREMGRLALSREIDRARRSDGRFVMAFVDVNGLKAVNDRDGHAAGDRVLQVVVRAIRSRLRSFDPIIRYGGDEFVCGLGGIDLSEAERRFAAIQVGIEADSGVGISVGLAALAAGETVDQLTERADAAMLRFRRDAGHDR